MSSASMAVFTRYATLFYAHLFRAQTRVWCRSTVPRRDAPRSGAVANLKLQSLQFPLGVHVDGCPHGLFVPGTYAGGASVCNVAPYA